MVQYYEVFISAETQAQADTILNSLLKKRLATGGQFLVSPARFLWKGAIHDRREYLTITSFTTVDKKAALIRDVERTATETVPMVRFIPIEVNSQLATWIDQTLS